MSSTFRGHRDGFSSVDSKAKFSKYSKYMLSIIGDNGEPTAKVSRCRYILVSILKRVVSTRKFSILINVPIGKLVRSFR